MQAFRELSGALLRRHVAGDDGGSDELPVLVDERRDAQGDPNDSPAAIDALALVVIDPVARQHLLEDPALLAGAMLGNQNRDRLSDRLVGAVAVHALGGRVPARDDAV